MKQSRWNFSRTQKALLVSFVLLFLGSVVGLLWNFYKEHTVSFPSEGGTYREGAVGMIDQNFILNPLFVTLNNKSNSVDASISRLIFSGLMKFEATTGDIVDHLATHTLSEDKTIYTFQLKEGLLWHDGLPVTADDIMYTYQTVIQNPEFPNTNLREAFKDVVIERIDDRTVSFTIPKPYKFFLTNFAIGLVPKHLLEEIPPSQFQYAEFNQNPVGCGPYRFTQITFEEDPPVAVITLEAFPEYISGKPKIALVEYKLFPTADLLMRNLGSLDALHPRSKDQFEKIGVNEKFVLHDFTLPQYVAVFINMDSPKFSGTEKYKVRLALQLATDKDEILKLVPGKRIDTPLLETNITEWLFEYEPMKAQGALKDSGWYLANASASETPPPPAEASPPAEETTPAESASLPDESLHSAAGETKYTYHPNSKTEIWTTVEKDFILGTFPEGTTKVTVNGYRLKLFEPEKGKFSYRISTEIGTLKEGENVYTIRFYDGSKKLDEETVTIHYTPDPSKIPADVTIANPPETDETPPVRDDEGTTEETPEETTPEETPGEEVVPPAETPGEGEAIPAEETPPPEETIPTIPEDMIFPEGIRRNEAGEPLTFTLVTVSTPSFYPAVAEELKRQWEKVGIYLMVEVLEPDVFMDKAILKKEYDLLLYGQNMGYNLDAYPFWHFSQADQGLNLSKYRSFEAGILLEEVRQTHDESYRAKKLSELREIIKNDIPAVFLFTPYYTFPIDSKVKNVKINAIALNPDRFADIEHWYIRESRTFEPEKGWSSFFPWFFTEVKDLF